jgi:hypothetical protein
MLTAWRWERHGAQTPNSGELSSDPRKILHPAKAGIQDDVSCTDGLEPPL